jgi:uncharacterized membrane protein
VFPRKFLILLGCISVISACTYDNEEELFPVNNCDTEDVSYANDIQPILLNYRCISCHNTTSPGGSVELDTYDEVKIYVDNARLMGSINHTDGFVSMPLGSSTKVSECEISKLQSWIDAGANNN